MIERLSSREDEVVDMIVKGFSNAEIASRLGVTEKTIKFHLTNIYAKKGVLSRAQLISTELRKEKSDNEFLKLMGSLLK